MKERKFRTIKRLSKGGTRAMQIIHCPKGGRVPEGYCKVSCLNYPGKAERDKRITEQKEKVTPLTKRDSYIDY